MQEPFLNIISREEYISHEVADLKEKAKSLFKLVSSEIFEIAQREKVDLRAIQFRAYTPYFNDGDECVYRVYGIEALIPTKMMSPKTCSVCGQVYKDIPHGFPGSPIQTYSFCSQDGAPLSSKEIEVLEGIESYSVEQPLRGILINLEKWLSNHLDLIRFAFGDHRMVKINKDGSVISEEYNHE